MNQLRVGVKIMQDNAPCIIVDSDFVKPGKGQAFVRLRYKNLMTGRVNEKTLKSSESVEGADITETEMQYLYNDADFWYFMDPDSFEQIGANRDAIGDYEKFLKEEDMCLITLYNGNPIIVVPPNFVILQITETDPGVKGDTSGGGSKPATLDTGAVVRIPLFVQEGEFIKVDTRTGEYVSRAKES